MVGFKPRPIPLLPLAASACVWCCRKTQVAESPWHLNGATGQKMSYFATSIAPCITLISASEGIRGVPEFLQASREAWFPELVRTITSPGI